MSRDLIHIVETAYCLERDTQQWYDALCESLVGLAPGDFGVMVYGYDASRPDQGVDTVGWAAAQVTDEFVEATLALNRDSDPQQVRQFYHAGILCGTVSEFYDRPADAPPYGEHVQPHGYPDTFGLSASGPTGVGVAVNSPFRQISTITKATRQRWFRIGAHLQAAFRLRRALTRNPADPEAVLEPGAGVIHAEPAASSPSARQTLREAAKRIEAARTGSTRQNDDEALSLWQGLIDGRWSLVDRFDSDGRRYLVAYANPHAVSDPRALTLRERQVAGLVGAGESNKAVGYRLGLSAGAVATLLRRALDKLGLDSRAELIWLHATLTTRNE
jgi:DNA-binding CsgD family transcriptional regulator